MRVIIHHVIFSDFSSFIFSSSIVETALRIKCSISQNFKWWIVTTIMCHKCRLSCTELQLCNSQPKLLSSPLSHAPQSTQDCVMVTWMPFKVAVFSHHLIPLSLTGAWNYTSHCYQVSGFPYLCNDEAHCHHWSLSPHLTPPWGIIKQMSTSKRNQSINRCFLLGNRLPFQEGHKRRWSGPRTTHLTRSSLLQGLSIHHCHKRAFLLSTSCRYCPSLLP